MIQRIQSVWLFIAALLNGLLFISPLYRYAQAGTPDVKLLSASNFFPLLTLAALITLLPLITIFLFGNRKIQQRLTIVGILGCIAFIGVMLMHISSLRAMTPPAINDSYLVPGALLPVIAIVFFLLAFRGIRKDDKLVKSVDRLR